MRGDVYRLPRPRGIVGHEHDGARYAVVLQSDDLAALSTVIVAPTSTRAHEATFRPEVRVRGDVTRVLVEQMTAVSPERLGELVGHLGPEEFQQVTQAMRRVLALDLPW